MALITRAISALTNGVSRQPDLIRLDSQAEEQLNGISQVTDGVGPRPCSKVLARLATELGNAKFFPLVGADGNTYIGVLTGTGVFRVFDLDGVEQTVTALSAEAQAYLNSGSDDPRRTFQVLNVEGQTLVLNRTITPAMDSAVTASVDPQPALVWVRQGIQNHQYRVMVKNWVYTNNHGSVNTRYHNLGTTPQKESTYVVSFNNTGSVDTQAIAAAIRDALFGYGLTPGEFTNWQIAYGAIVPPSDAYLGAWYLTNRPNTSGSASMATPSVFTIEYDPQYDVSVNAKDLTFASDDGAGGGTALVVAHKEVPSLDQLPAENAPAGFHIKVSGANNDAEDDFYVEYNGRSWVETLAQGVKYAFDYDTMPFVIVQDTGTGNWSVGQGAWAERTVGDEVSAPEPAFVGQPIRYMFLYKNRVGFLTERAINFSEAGEPLNFWPTTVRQVLDSDPIEIALASSDSSRDVTASHAFAVGEELVVVGKDTQIVLTTTDDLFVFGSISADVASYYDLDVSLPPVVVGNRAHLLGRSGRNLPVWEYSRDASGSYNALDIAAHVPGYLPAAPTLFIGSQAGNMLVLGDDTQPNKLWVHNFYYAGQEKIQSAWHRWEFDDSVEIVDAFFLQDVLYLLLANTTNSTTRTWIEKIELLPADTEPGVFDYPVRMDHLFEVTLGAPVYDPAADLTTVPLPYAIHDDDGYTVAVGGSKQGRVYSPGTVSFDPAGPSVDIPGQLVIGDKLYFGRANRFLYEFSTIRLKSFDYSTRQNRLSTTGRLQLHNMKLVAKNAGVMRVEVTPQGMPTRTKVFTPRTTGLAIIGPLTIEAQAQFGFDIGANAEGTSIRVINDSITPGVIIAAEWTGRFYDKRTGRGGY